MHLAEIYLFGKKNVLKETIKIFILPSIYLIRIVFFFQFFVSLITINDFSLCMLVRCQKITREVSAPESAFIETIPIYLYAQERDE
jgi:hypothetical protein